jgi:hypothetical protein
VRLRYRPRYRARCRALAVKIANELRNKRPEHFVDRLSLADIQLALTSTAAMKSRRLVTSRKLADGLKGLCACQLAASPLAGRGGRRRRRQHRRRRYRAKYTTCQPSKRCGSSSRSMESGMPDCGFGRCDGHHEMIDFRLALRPPLPGRGRPRVTRNGGASMGGLNSPLRVTHPPRKDVSPVC